MPKVLVEMDEEVKAWLLKQVAGIELVWSHEDGFPYNLRLSRESLAALRAAKPAADPFEVDWSKESPDVTHIAVDARWQRSSWTGEPAVDEWNKSWTFPADSNVHNRGMSLVWNDNWRESLRRRPEGA